MKICAEIGQVAGADLNDTLMLVAEAKEAGFDAVKIQAIHPETLVVPGAQPYWDGADHLGQNSQLQAFAKAGCLNEDQIRVTAGFCKELGMEFVITPFGLEWISLCAEVADRIKIASGDIRWKELIWAAGETEKPLIVSTGASHWAEVYDVLAWTRNSRNRSICFLACTLDYPTAGTDAELGRIRTLYNGMSMSPDVMGGRMVEIGYSDHTSLPEVAMCVAAMGADWLEVHFSGSLTDSERAEVVGDCAFALDRHAAVTYVAAAHRGLQLRGTGRLVPTTGEVPALVGARRGLYVARPIEEGHVIEREDIAVLRPANQMDPAKMDELIGVRAWHSLEKGESFT